MLISLKQVVESTQRTPVEIAEESRRIYRTLLARSPWLEQGNFEQVHPQDLRLLFDEYDRRFFAGQLHPLVEEKRLTFRLAPRLTKAGGKTTRTIQRTGDRTPRYEIAVSSFLLFHSFQDHDRPIVVAGVICRDRLEALQRIFEHELIHLTEMLVWHDSNCAASRFQRIAHGLFHHQEHTHRLITPDERAWTTQGIRPGSRVRFRQENATIEGVVNRITKRATVLVEDPKGQLFTDGKRYTAWYVPLERLEVI